MKRPAFQFYPADWRNNAKLRRCSEGARGAWIDILCLLHDFDEYGVCRWPLADMARAANIPMRLVKELVEKNVLKGADKDAEPYIYTPRHAGKDGEPVILVSNNGGPVWYCSRFVRDEYIRQKRGQNTRFDDENNPQKNQPKVTPKSTPKGGIGDGLGDGSTSTSSSTSKTTVLDTSSNTVTSPAPVLTSGQLAAELIKLGVSVTGQHPMLLDWHKNYTHEQILEAVALARQHKPEPEKIPPKYLNTILSNPRSPPKRDKPKSFDDINYREGISADGKF
jgi:hypothetical protein